MGLGGGAGPGPPGLEVTFESTRCCWFSQLQVQRRREKRGKVEEREEEEQVEEMRGPVTSDLVGSLPSGATQWHRERGTAPPCTVSGSAAPSSGSLVVVLLVAVQLLGVVGGHVREILKYVLVGFITCKKQNK